MNTPVPYESLDRSHWPKSHEAEGYEIGELAATEFAALAELMATAKVTPTWTEADWSAGRVLVFAARNLGTGQLDAAYGVALQEARVDGERRPWGRLALAVERPGLKGPSEPCLMVRVGHALYRQRGGRDDLEVILGAPAFDDYLIGRKEGVPGHALQYAVVRTEMVLLLEADQFEARLGHLPDFPVEVKPGGSAEIATLADSLAAQAPGAFHRSAEQLSLHYPAERFQTVVRHGEDGEPLSAAIYTECDWPRPGTVVIADWQCGDHDYESGLTLVRHILKGAIARGASGLALLLPEWAPWFHHFQWHGFLVHPVEDVTVARSFLRAQDAAWLRESFFYTAGDLELPHRAARKLE